MQWIVDLAPFIMVVCICAMVFGYKVVKMVVEGEDHKAKKVKKGRNGRVSLDPGEIEDLISMATDLTRRIENLEAILCKDEAQTRVH